MTFVEHLTELRRRLLTVFLSVLAGAIVCYLFIEEIVAILLVPTHGVEFVYLAPPELFLAYLRLSLVLGIVITLPISLMQLWLFARPALTKAEKRAARFVLWGGTLFFAAGVYFAYTVILPLTMRFFLQYATQAIQPMFSFGGYVGFVLSILLAFGIAFEMPMVIVILTAIGLITPALLRSARRPVIVVLVVVAAFLTPPDVVSQLLLAGPMLLLYELSVLLSRLTVRRRESEPDDQHNDQSA
ncbi:MAG: twin-arginine translocase subunit TatC [Spirochaetaceae bacterium]|nr:MAG: twin-arginine translocase subunit TatC [Spirochaetaceae bacterium]